jgi:Tfp pilus assembly PilM family ATPase
MARSYPPDVIVLDNDSVVHARLTRGAKNPQITVARTLRIPADTFGPGAVTPLITNEQALADVLTRMRNETGRWDKVSLLLPDSWFRINLMDVAAIPDSRAEAADAVRWALKRTLPINPDHLRVAYDVLSRHEGGARVLVVTGLEKTLASLEAIFAAAGSEVVLIEPIGLNIWNAVAVREAPAATDRLFLYIRRHDFTTAVFRDGQPLFIRSRNLSGERTLLQEMKLSANYLRDTLRSDTIEQCYLAGNDLPQDVAAAISEEFSAPVRTIALRDVTERFPDGVRNFEAELTACAGVFTA